MIPATLTAYLSKHGFALLSASNFPRFVTMTTHSTPSTGSLPVPSPASGDAAQSAPLSAIVTEGDPLHGGASVRRGGTKLGSVHANCLGHWIGAPLNANSRVFFEKDKAIEWVVECEGKPAPRFSVVHEEPFYAAGMRHVVRGAGLRLHVCLGQDRERRPLVTLQELIGGAGDYSPADLRVIAEKLVAIADDAEGQPMGKRSFFRSYRRY